MTFMHIGLTYPDIVSGKQGLEGNLISEYGLLSKDHN